MSNGDIKKEVAKNVAPQRMERKPIGGVNYKLTVTGQEAGFHYAWINDDQVDERLDNGFEFVTHAVRVGTKHIDVSKMQGAKIQRNVGGGVIAYLMRIPQEFYDADMRAQQGLVDQSEEQLAHDINSNGLNGSLQIGDKVFVSNDKYKP